MEIGADLTPFRVGLRVGLDVLQHLAAPLAALKEMRRVLKPGGVIGIVDGSSTITPSVPDGRFGDEERQWNSGLDRSSQ